jgi:putative nucleotidyltransferase with HDIG domain
MRLPIRYRIILPFTAVLLFVGVIGTGVASARLASAASAQFDATLLHSSLQAHQLLSQLDANRMADLRRATDTVGVSEALGAGNFAMLDRLLTPVTANVSDARIQVHVLDARGNEVLGIRGTSAGPSSIAISDAGAFATEPTVVKVLAGQGATDRLVFFRSQGPEPTVYWTGSVRTASGRIVGAVLVGEPLAEIASGIPGSTFYDLSGTRLVTTVRIPPVARATIRHAITSDNTVGADDTQSGHTYGAVFSTWTMRGSQFGFLAMQANADWLVEAADQIRLILMLVFTAAALLTLLVGTATASRLTRPIELLMRSMRAVSAGDLKQRATIASTDEIGYLAHTFNEMTASLEEKTAALEETTFASIEALARAIDARDRSTFGHSARVAAVSLEIADAMQLPIAEREALRRGALLHDIGKIGVEDRVLRKPGPLTAWERDAMREHSRIGYEMLKGLRFLRPSLPGVLHHHERWDGNGYPKGLAGTAIPMPVRILAVADVFDALTSERPYRQGLSFEAASVAIWNEAGRQFDPDVVTAFLDRRPAIEALLRNMRTAVPMILTPEAA